MYVLIVALGLAVAVWIHAGADRVSEDAAAVRQARVASLTHALILYHDAVTRYAVSHPAFNGAVAASDLDLPLWFTNPGLVNDILVDGTARTWLPANAAALMDQASIVAELDHALMGYANFGRVMPDGYFHAQRGVVPDIDRVKNIPVGATVLFTRLHL